MRVQGFRRYRTWRQRIFRNVCIGIFGIIFLDLLAALRRFQTFEKNLIANTVHEVKDLPIKAKDQKIYIVAQFWTSADVLLGHWQDSLLYLIDTLGVENVYVSILASKGLDNTDEVLRYFDSHHLEPRKVRRTIVIDPTTHQDEIDRGPVDEHGNQRSGWIYSGESDPPGQKELRRIPYLSRLRNQGLEPLQEMREKQGLMFDKILFLNDVIYRPSDVLSLLATNQGTYDVACSLDYHLDERFYDTFVLRDTNFDPAITRYFPMFRSSTSRNALLKGRPIPVKSCWNGMVAAVAAPYYDATSASSTTSTDTSKRVFSKGLQFRGVEDSMAQLHLEASECCLIHADLIDRDQVKDGIYMNPSVRVGYMRDPHKYKTTAYEDIHTGPKGLGWVTINQYVRGIWKIRLLRWVKPVWLESWTVARKVKLWKSEGRKLGEVREEVGTFCVIDEMHFLVWNGWKHVADHFNR